MEILSSIETLFKALEEQTGKSKQVLYKECKISQAHFDRVKANPEHYAPRVAKLKNRIKELLDAHEAAKKNLASNPPITTYGGNTYNDNDFTPEAIKQEIYLMSLDIAHLTGTTRLQNQRLIAENKAFKEFFASDGSAEDKKILRERLEQIELTYNPATIQDTVVPVPSTTRKPRKKKPKKGNGEPPSPPDEPMP